MSPALDVLGDVAKARPWQAACHIPFHAGSNNHDQHLPLIEDHAADQLDHDVAELRRRDAAHASMPVSAIGAHLIFKFETTGTHWSAQAVEVAFFEAGSGGRQRRGPRDAAAVARRPKAGLAGGCAQRHHGAHDARRAAGHASLWTCSCATRSVAHCSRLLLTAHGFRAAGSSFLAPFLMSVLGFVPASWRALDSVEVADALFPGLSRVQYKLQSLVDIFCPGRLQVEGKHRAGANVLALDRVLTTMCAASPFHSQDRLQLVRLGAIRSERLVDMFQENAAEGRITYLRA